MKKVIIESPFSSKSGAESEYENQKYARACLLDSLNRGEAPIASHLLHTQVLDDNDANQRDMGIKAGLAWTSVADLSAFYVDYGWSEGMKKAWDLALENEYVIQTRRIL